MFDFYVMIFRVSRKFAYTSYEIPSRRIQVTDVIN